MRWTGIWHPCVGVHTLQTWELDLEWGRTNTRMLRPTQKKKVKKKLYLKRQKKPQLTFTGDFLRPTILHIYPNWCFKKLFHLCVQHQVPHMVYGFNPYFVSRSKLTSFHTWALKIANSGLASLLSCIVAWIFQPYTTICIILCISETPISFA